jgi:2,3-dihydroxybiphenyl 1,2-dioxygenase
MLGDIIALGYIGVRSGLLEDWGQFASGLLGMQSVDRGAGQASFRMDDRKQRLLVLDEPGDTLAFLGFEAASPEALDRIAARLEDAGTRVARAPRDLCARRFVTDLLAFDDPAGNHVELFFGPETTSDTFVPGRPISGFKTGPLGMGHVVLKSPSVDLLVPFYRDVLGFAVSDFGRTPYPLYFFHLNERHHSFAMVGAAASGLHHFMVEFGALDDVGQGYDLALLEEGRIAYTLGRHTNDYMTSFYAHSPSGFFVENGWGGRLIDPETWEPHETFDGPSFWGHDRTYMEEPQRKRLEEMRLSAAAHGKQAPPMIDCPWLWQTLDRAGGQ